MNEDSRALLIQVIIIIISVVASITLGIHFLLRGLYILAYYSFWMVLFPVGVYMLFTKHVYFRGWDLSTKDRRVGVGLLFMFVFPLIGTCNMAWNGTFLDARITQEREAWIQANPILSLRLPFPGSEFRHINALYYAVISRTDPARPTRSTEETFEQLKTELLDRLNLLIDNSDTTGDVLDIAMQMLYHAERAELPPMERQ